MKKRILTIGIISLVLILSVGYFLAGTVLEMDKVVEGKLMQATSSSPIGIEKDTEANKSRERTQKWYAL